MDTVTYRDARVAPFITRHFLPVSIKENARLLENYW
jgi:hypothetical protein